MFTHGNGPEILESSAPNGKDDMKEQCWSVLKFSFRSVEMWRVVRDFLVLIGVEVGCEFGCFEILSDVEIFMGMSM
jgi:hypothetical protein